MANNKVRTGISGPRFYSSGAGHGAPHRLMSAKCWNPLETLEDDTSIAESEADTEIADEGIGRTKVVAARNSKNTQRENSKPTIPMAAIMSKKTKRTATRQHFKGTGNNRDETQFQW